MTGQPVVKSTIVLSPPNNETRFLPDFDFSVISSTIKPRGPFSITKSTLGNHLQSITPSI